MPELSIAGEDAYYFHKAENKTSSQCTRHYHNSFEIYYLKDGGCNYFIDNRSYDLQSGDIVLIPEGVIHKTNYDKNEPHTRFLINCSAAYVPRSVLPMIPSMMYLYRNKEISKSVEDLFVRIAEEYERHDAFRDEALRCLSFELFFLLARNANECSEVSSGSLFIEETVKYIQKNYMNDITLSMMAKLNSVSSEHLSRTFKKETGFGFSEYLTLVRLQKAEYMLRNEPGRSILEIAYACGFNDSNYFSDKFRRSYGVAPSSLRKRSRR
jgi:AraC-like DNA-binding protein